MEPTKTNTVDQFFNDLPNEDKMTANIFDDKRPDASPEKDGASTQAGAGTEESEPRRNRRHRRLEEQLQREREANIALNERVKVLSEVEQFAKESGGQIDPRLIKAFGTSDEGKELARIFTDLRTEDREAAKKDALMEFEQQQIQLQKEETQYETFIDTELEYLEDAYNVDLTSDSPAARKARREFIQVVQDVSPKDDQGELTGFADFDSAFQLYQKTRQESKPDLSSERRRGIASTSMQKSGQSGNSNSSPTPGFRGWMKDYKL